LFALAPAVQLSRVDLMRVLRQAGTSDPASPRSARLRAALVAGEVALLVVLLASAALMQRSLARLASVDAGAALSWPFDYTGFTWAPNVNVPDHPFEAEREPVAQTASVTPGYFATMGIPIVRGRDFGPDDRPGAPVAALVSRTFASRFFPGEDPIGRHVTAMRI